MRAGYTPIMDEKAKGIYVSGAVQEILESYFSMNISTTGTVCSPYDGCPITWLLYLDSGQTHKLQKDFLSHNRAME